MADVGPEWLSVARSTEWIASLKPWVPSFLGVGQKETAAFDVPPPASMRQRVTENFSMFLSNYVVVRPDAPVAWLAATPRGSSLVPLLFRR